MVYIGLTSWNPLGHSRPVTGLIYLYSFLLGHAVVEAQRYEPEGRGFDSLWCHWNFSLTRSFRRHYGPGIDSASKRNEYQEYFLTGKSGRCVGLTTSLPSYADCLEILESRPPGTLRACPGLCLDCLTFYSSNRTCDLPACIAVPQPTASPAIVCVYVCVCVCVWRSRSGG